MPQVVELHAREAGGLDGLPPPVAHGVLVGRQAAITEDTAQAAQALKDALNRNLARAMTRSIPRFVEQAAEDLEPTFEKLAKELATARPGSSRHTPRSTWQRT